MSLKKLLGLDNVSMTDCELMARIREAQTQNQDFVEFEVNGEIIRMSLPNISVSSLRSSASYRSMFTPPSSRP